MQTTALFLISPNGAAVALTVAPLGLLTRALTPSDFQGLAPPGY